MSKREGTGRPYRRLVSNLRAQGLPCWICGRPIDYSAPCGAPLSFEYDHYFPASRWREFGYESQRQCVMDPANGRAAHRVCNERRQDAMPWEPRWAGKRGNRPKPPASPPSKRSHAL